MTVEQMNFGFHLKERPKTRPNQVLDVSKVKVGDEYLAVNGSGIARIIVLTLPHRLEDLPNVQGIFIDVEEDISAMHAQFPEIVPPTQKTRISLADFAVMPYESGQWNPENHLLKVNKEQKFIKIEYGRF